MGGSDKELKISYGELLMPEQKAALKWLLDAAGSAMGGFTLGAPYQPGGYTPFTLPAWTGLSYGGGNSRFGPPPPGVQPGPGEEKPSGDPWTDDELVWPGRGGSNPYRNRPSDSPALPMSVAMNQFFSNPYSMAGSGGLGAFTQPFVNPYYSAITGNYPRGG